MHGWVCAHKEINVRYLGRQAGVWVILMPCKGREVPFLEEHDHVSKS
jgi:hypothetical protein